ncbi:carbohydrate kinase [Labrenzia aggregata]|uniref:Carbohydrate kinase n=2 Tax=Roseibium aggregatum TaxID=187304 RepID=A0A939J0Q9_9HYPH|nr:carbohydrate kinase [Roseibium aggregatum]
MDTIAHAFQDIRPETSTPAQFGTSPGGVATNVARALNRLGLETCLVGSVGDDGAAQALTRQLDAEGLRLCLVPRPGFATGRYVALHDPDGSLKAACVDDRILSEAPADLFDAVLDEIAGTAPGRTIWFVEANLPAPVLTRVLERTGSGLVFANAVSNAKSVRLKPHLRRLNCLMLNRGEAAALTGKPEGTPLAALAEALRHTGLETFVLTDGGSQLMVLEDGSFERFVPAVTSIVDVTGAGDALTAGIIAALARGFSLKEAVPFGLSAAALTLRTTGALAGSLSWAALGGN